MYIQLAVDLGKTYSKQTFGQAGGGSKGTTHYSFETTRVLSEEVPVCRYIYIYNIYIV